LTSTYAGGGGGGISCTCAPFGASVFESLRRIQWVRCNLSTLASAVHNHCTGYHQKGENEIGSVDRYELQTSGRSKTAPSDPPPPGIP
jgi:hypothetical protein